MSSQARTGLTTSARRWPGTVMSEPSATTCETYWKKCATKRIKRFERGIGREQRRWPASHDESRIVERYRGVQLRSGQENAGFPGKRRCGT